MSSGRDNPMLEQRSKAVNLLLRTCCSCDMFDHEEEKCRKFDMRPPAQVIAYGCDEYIEEIPF